MSGAIAVFTAKYQLYTYIIVYVATIFAGNISAFASFWLVRASLGGWAVPLLGATIFLAMLTGDLLWYTLGRTLRNTRLGEFLKRKLPHHEKIESHLYRNGGRWVFFAKFFYPSSFPVIFSVGWSKAPFRSFIKYSLLSIAVWVPVLLGLSYGLSTGLGPLRRIPLLGRHEVLIPFGVGVFLLVIYAVGLWVRRYLFANSGNENIDGERLERMR